MIYRKYVKRILDVILSFIALILLSPVFLVLAILVRVKLGSPVIFKQKRPGLNEKIFTMYKFRSMTDARDDNGELLPDGERLTKFGRWLRSTSLDELPELINIFVGDMSIVGPRPLLEQYIPLYSEMQRHRHDVRPGLTGLAQINGRNAISWEDKFSFDIEYIKNVAFINDCRIILATIAKVFKKENVSNMSCDTMTLFKGTHAPKDKVNISEEM